MDDDTIHADPSHPLLGLTGTSASGVTPLEQEVLDEYERLLRNMNQVSLDVVVQRAEINGGSLFRPSSRVLWQRCLVALSHSKLPKD
jgi:hypothetical protein